MGTSINACLCECELYRVDINELFKCAHVHVFNESFCVHNTVSFLFSALRLLLSLCICITHYFLYIANMAEHKPVMSDLWTNEYITVNTRNSSGKIGQGK